MTLLVREAGLSERMHRARPLRSVRVLVTAQLGGLVAMRGHWRARRHVRLGVTRAGGAGDVGDRRDVVPIEAVPEPQRGHPEKEHDDTEVHTAQVIASCRNSDSCKTLAITAVSKMWRNERRAIHSRGASPPA